MYRLWTESLAQDLRLGLRAFRRNKAFAVVAVTILALGIGVSTAMFSLVNAVLLRPLPYEEPHRLIRVWSSWTGFPRAPMSLPEYVDYSRTQAFESLALHSTQRFNLTLRDGETQTAYVEVVSGRFFEVFRVEPQIGRVIQPEDDTPEGRRVVVISHGYRLRRFGAASNPVGETLVLDGAHHTIIGVLPPSFQYPFPQIDLWVPVGIDLTQPAERDSRFANVIGRLGPNATLPQAQAQIDAVTAELKRTYPDEYGEDEGWGVWLERLQDYERGPYRASLLLLLAAGGLLLLIACANVANLLLANGAQRSQDAALRAALGASRQRLIRQFLTETSVLSIVGGLIGLGLAEFLLQALVRINPGVIPRSAEVHLDVKVAVFTAGAVALAALASGLAPALQAARWNLSQLLNASLRQPQSAAGGRKTSRALLIAQVALAAALLCGAGLLGRSFLNLQYAELGFEVDNVLTASVLPDKNRYAEEPQIASYYERLLERLRGLPSMNSAVVSIPPLVSSMSDREVTPEGFDARAMSNRFEQFRIVSPGYFKTLGIPILSGRDFERTDSAKSPRVVVINRALARKYWGDKDPLGQRLSLSDDPWATVIGVVADILEKGGAEPARPTVYAPLAQNPQRALTLLVRSPLPPEQLAGTLRSAAQDVDPGQHLGNPRPLRRAFRRSTEEPRFNAFLIGFFALLALFLAAAGLYGLLSYLVSGRHHEIGIRTALGAQRRDIVLMIVGAGLRWTVVGLAVGSAATLLLGRYLESLLVGVLPSDALTLVSVWSVLLTAALTACWFPARKASRTDPCQALREQ